MTEIFLKLLNMSIAASWLVLAVLVLRFALKKMPKWITCVLWGIVALRLVVPFYMQTDFSLIPNAEVIPQDIVTSEAPAIHSAIPALNDAVNPVVTQQVIQEEHTMENLLSIASVIWLLGMAGILAYGGLSSLWLWWRVRPSLLLRDNIYVCDNVVSPFVFGVFRPKIYIPSGIDAQLSYVLSHEQAHIRRRDYWWKPFGFCLLAVYWFNPLLWLAYILLCRDIERACDEKVIASMDISQRKGYSQALVDCSVHRRTIMVCPVAFGELSVKERVKGVFHYKKPAPWLVLLSVTVCAVTAVCFLTNPKSCPHSYSGVITVEATCTQKGMENRTCRLCRHSYTAAVDMCSHSYDDGIVTKVPTCIEQGEKELTCTDCGAKKSEVLEMTPHIDGESVVSIEPNCSQKGEVITTCNYCQATYVVEILEANDVHDFVETVIRESTCTEKGEGIKTCNRCDYSESVTYELEEHKPIGHVYYDGSCTYKGYIAWYCAVCGHNYIEYTDYGNHNWFKISYSSYSYHYKCLDCNAYKKGETTKTYNNDSSLTSTTGFSSKPPAFPVINIDDPFAPIWP